MSVAYPELHATRCVRFRYSYSECSLCRDACPHEAIELADDGVRIDAMRCRNCGLCVGACRTEALASSQIPRVETLKRAIGKQAFSWACAPSGQEADAVVPCLGALDAPTLGYLAKRGIPVELRGRSHCAQCAHGTKGPERLDVVLDAMEALCAASGEQWAPIKLVQDEEHEERPPHHADRRQLFRRLIGRAIDEAVTATQALPAAPVPERAIRAGAPFVAEQRELLQIICKRREGDDAFVLEPHAGLPLMQLGMAEGCTACEACFRVCPTAALQIEETSFSWALAVKTDRCVGCAACIEVCQPGALRAQEKIDARPGGEAVVLEKRAKQRCARCDRFFVSVDTAETCPVCLDDEEAFSAILG